MFFVFVCLRLFSNILFTFFIPVLGGIDYFLLLILTD